MFYDTDMVIFAPFGQ